MFCRCKCKYVAWAFHSGISCHEFLGWLQVHNFDHQLLSRSIRNGVEPQITRNMYMPDTGTLPFRNCQRNLGIQSHCWLQLIKCLAQGLNPLLRMRLKPGTPTIPSHCSTDRANVYMVLCNACLFHILTNKCLNVSDWCLVLGWRLYLFFILFFFLWFRLSGAYNFSLLHYYMRDTLISTSVPFT